MKKRHIHSYFFKGTKWLAVNTTSHLPIIGFKLNKVNYLSSTEAPASSNVFFSSSASALEMPSFRAAGADSTKSLASFKPKPVALRTALITATLLAPAAVNTTSNSVFSSAASAGPAATATAAAAAETPNFLPSQRSILRFQLQI